MSGRGPFGGALGTEDCSPGGAATGTPRREHPAFFWKFP